MVRYLIFLLFLLTMILQTQTVSANFCVKVSGSWKGEWQDERHKIYEAKLEMTQLNQSYFQGKFILSDGSTGTVNGKCKSEKFDEAYLILRKDPPWYNPCRGMIMQVDKTIMIHFYCFKPNQSGYFELT